MTKDTGLKPDEALLWNNLGYAQAGLKNYDDAITSYKKAIDLETASKKPRLPVIGEANEGLGEIYARTGKVPEANAAFDAAAKADPANAPLYLRNEAVIFYQQNNNAAQTAAADEAIKIDPNQALLYYIKGQGLVANATVDPKTNRIVLPPDCVAAYQKYLELAPTALMPMKLRASCSRREKKSAPPTRRPKPTNLAAFTFAIKRRPHAGAFCVCRSPLQSIVAHASLRSVCAFLPRGASRPLPACFSPPSWPCPRSSPPLDWARFMAASSIPPAHLKETAR